MTISRVIKVSGVDGCPAAWFAAVIPGRCGRPSPSSKDRVQRFNCHNAHLHSYKQASMPKKWKQSSTGSSYVRLQQADQYCEEEAGDGGRALTTAPKGFVPILVGLEPGPRERVLVKVKQFNKDPRVLTLLETAEVEMGGCRQQGVLSLNCDARYFKTLVGATTTT